MIDAAAEARERLADLESAQVLESDSELDLGGELIVASTASEHPSLVGVHPGVLHVEGGKIHLGPESM